MTTRTPGTVTGAGIIVKNKKILLCQKITNWCFDDNTNIINKQVEEVAENLLASMGVRWECLSRQKLEDRVLDQYRLLTSAVLRGKDQEQLVEAIAQFLMLIGKNIDPRSSSDYKPMLGTLLSYRDCMWYWISKSTAQTLMFLPKPDRKLYFRRTTEVLQWMKVQGKFNMEERTKVYLDLPELVQMIEFDLINTPNIVVAEQQHLAWLFGYTCGDRRRFAVAIHFRHLKVDLETKLSKSIQPTLKMAIGSPVRRAMLSIPHRLLVISIRRGFLEHHTTIKSPMSAKEVNIKIRDNGLFDMGLCSHLIDGNSGDQIAIERSSYLSLHRAEHIKKSRDRDQLLEKLIMEHQEIQDALIVGSFAVKNTKRRLKRIFLQGILVEKAELEKLCLANEIGFIQEIFEANSR
ncbi:hypothetical protein HYFRA_00002976 [Hymenoscyphus fraxineus]|uniref:Uncharacterized protein n=1 Tax=Hymenoscyphus fraxineus TaxID=746836 RepID=A0A9N9KPK8_9HELO|nr:hypothetical protein HYFRA_00002976 [Hymenoscyphus fraxineus]